MHMGYRLLALCVIGLCGSLIAQAAAPETDLVILVETDDSLCQAHGGMLVTLQLSEAAQLAQISAVEVWVDRWFMQVQTADHTKHSLTAAEQTHELGCSHSIAGPQHWTISAIKHLPAGSESPRKER